MLEAVYGCLQLILFVGNGRQTEKCHWVYVSKKKADRYFKEGMRLLTEQVSLVVLQIPQQSLSSFILRAQPHQQETSQCSVCDTKLTTPYKTPLIFSVAQAIFNVLFLSRVLYRVLVTMTTLTAT